MEVRGATEEGRRGGRRGVDEVTCGRGTTTGIQSLPQAPREDTHYPLQGPGTPLRTRRFPRRGEARQPAGDLEETYHGVECLHTHALANSFARTHTCHALHKIRACKIPPQYTLGLRLTLD